ncbi:MAG TPA: hypothetical protein VJT67_11565 [Longimicrobiaceae bacterium]|nr:hypothetical protein [Longimicrobiaceae bacterium]
MANETPGNTDPRMPGTDPGTVTAAGAAKAASRPVDVHDRHPHQLYCRCGHPLHPDHIEMHRGMKLERYSCPKLRWWNGHWHPHAWMEPRQS